MVILHGINDNVIIPHLSYFGVYQNEEMLLYLYKEINNVLGLEPNQKTDIILVHVSPSKFGIHLNSRARCIFEWVLGVVG